MGEVEAPPGRDGDLQALKVVGQGLSPRHEDGDIVYFDASFTPPPETQLGRECVVCFNDESMVIRTIRSGSEPGLFILMALNDPPMRNIQVR